MRTQPALRVALDLMHMPTRIRQTRAAPLPKGIDFLLRVAADDKAAQLEAVELTGRPLGEIRRAAVFFIEQVLLAPDADSYRVLGAARDASNAELRKNMALLMRWLHPDRGGGGQHGLFAGRVTGAWDDLKTSERRQSYDRRLSELHKPAIHRKSHTRSISSKQTTRRRRVGAVLKLDYEGARKSRQKKSQSFFLRAFRLFIGRLQS